MKRSQQTSVEASGMASDFQMGRGSEKSAPSVQQTTTDTIAILSSNVWFRKYLEFQSRINAIGNIILQHQPHVIYFQVLTSLEIMFQTLPCLCAT